MPDSRPDQCRMTNSAPEDDSAEQGPDPPPGIIMTQTPPAGFRVDGSRILRLPSRSRDRFVYPHLPAKSAGRYGKPLTGFLADTCYQRGKKSHRRDTGRGGFAKSNQVYRVEAEGQCFPRGVCLLLPALVMRLPRKAAGNLLFLQRPAHHLLILLGFKRACGVDKPAAFDQRPHR